MKSTQAVLWKEKGGSYGITLHLPVVMLDMKKGTSKNRFTEIKKVNLPRPMTSNQFNNFITSDDGKKWAGPIFNEVMK